ncbi:MAG: hypothetical protein O7G31_11850 [Calditrichaeota bacterium]|nr:hypothetical protein [Calditrichota bacterium]
MKFIIQGKMLMSMILVAVFGIAFFGGSDALAKCDLKVTFVAPTGNTVTSGQAVTWTLQFKNIGKSACKANRIKLSRYSGTTGSGYGSAIGGSGNLQKLPALAPGESVDLSFVEKKPPSKGTYTYKIRFSSPHNDANNRNHGPTKTVTFKRGTTRRPPISRGRPKSGLCDLETTFTAPTGNTVTGGQAVTWTLKFENIGSGQCAANTIRLRRYSGNTASGYGTAVGGSGNLKTLPALAAAGSVNLSFVENYPPNTGTYSYKASYSSPHNDGNNFNHHPTKTVTFQAGAAPGPPDLFVESVLFHVGPAVGNCNSVTVTVKNLGGLANQITKVTVILFPTGNPFQNRVQKDAFFSAFPPGQSQSRTISGLNIAVVGSWTMQVVADSGQQLAESNENNNIFTQNNINVTQNCQ